MPRHATRLEMVPSTYEGLPRLDEGAQIGLPREATQLLLAEFESRDISLISSNTYSFWGVTNEIFPPSRPR
jgi:hypothetical protein